MDLCSECILTEMSSKATEKLELVRNPKAGHKKQMKVEVPWRVSSHRYVH